MNDPLHRARLLMNVSRYEEAERSLRQSLSRRTGDAEAHALLSQCLLEQEKFVEATEEAETAVGLAPDAPMAHYVLAQVWAQRHYRDKALAAIDEAIRLDPQEAAFHAYQAVMLFDAARWQDALSAAETALAIDPEHLVANNVRAMALVKLGRRAEAGQTIDATLARDPEDAWSHANKGWALLEQRKPQEAVEHFREALRLEPNFEYARLGIVEALKAKNPIYGFFLRYALAMTKLPPKWQFGVLVGAWFGNQVLQQAAVAMPAIAPMILPISLAYIAFVLFTWLAQPMFNLLLRLHPLGRYALSDKERWEASLIGGCLGAAAIGFGLSFLGDYWTVGLIVALHLVGLTFAVHLAFKAAAGWPRLTLIGVCTVMALLSGSAIIMALLFEFEAYHSINRAYFYLWIATIWGGQLIAAARPRR